MKRFQLVLFDLDGTLADTAPDMALALNLLREQHQLPPLPLEDIRPHVGYGAAQLLKIGLNIDEAHPAYTKTLEDYLNLYHVHLADTTTLFNGMDKVLLELESKQIPWGIVTNKPSRFTLDLLKKMGLLERAACIVCGDTLTKRKPHPEPILHACELLNLPPSACLYVGDTLTDVTASKAAGTTSLVTLYGYIQADEKPETWGADIYVKQAEAILDWV